MFDFRKYSKETIQTPATQGGMESPMKTLALRHLI